MDRRNLASEALHLALAIRQKNGVALNQAFDVFDFAASLGIEVRFVDIPSLEAMYIRDALPRILVSSHRPAPRQRYSCAHELGHHFLGHGTKIDEFVNDSAGQVSSGLEEYAADRFASFLLMPKSLVNYAYVTHGWLSSGTNAEQAYIVAGWLGVGYSTLLMQMSRTLHFLTSEKADQLLKTSPKTIRRGLMEGLSTQQLLVVDHHWSDRAIDVAVGDSIILPHDVHFEGHCAQMSSEVSRGAVFRAVSPGVGQLELPGSGWTCFLRVCKQRYVGRAIFRHLADENYV